MRDRPRQAGLLAVLAFAAAGCATVRDPGYTVSVPARAETVRVAGEGDAADDPAIYVAPDPARSLILGTDKTAGLYVYDLQGEIKTFFPLGRLNNVDLRSGFTHEGRPVAIAAASNRTEYSLVAFIIDDVTGDIRNPSGELVPLKLDEPYGLCMTRRDDGAVIVGVNNVYGDQREVRLGLNANWVVAVEQDRFDVGGKTEGCVYDDRNGDLYIGEEMIGVWRYRDNPEDEDDIRALVAPVDGARLVADVEGVTIYPVGEDGGWLIASSQGDGAFAVYALPDMTYVGRFRIAANAAAGIDEVTHTDGIDVTSKPLPGYPAGLFVVQDDEDDEGGQNFKLVDWRDIAAALGL